MKSNYTDEELAALQNIADRRNLEKAIWFPAYAAIALGVLVVVVNVVVNIVASYHGDPMRPVILQILFGIVVASVGGGRWR